MKRMSEEVFTVAVAISLFNEYVGYAPTQSELTVMTGYNRARVSSCISYLLSEGIITKQRKKPRTLTLYNVPPVTAKCKSYSPTVRFIWYCRNYVVRSSKWRTVITRMGHTRSSLIMRDTYPVDVLPFKLVELLVNERVLSQDAVELLDEIDRTKNMRKLGLTEAQLHTGKRYTV